VEEPYQVEADGQRPSLGAVEGESKPWRRYGDMSGYCDGEDELMLLVMVGIEVSYHLREITFLQHKLKN